MLSSDEAITNSGTAKSNGAARSSKERGKAKIDKTIKINPMYLNVIPVRVYRNVFRVRIPAR